eukprot:1344835-Pyramimonas_sp.AAC.1
MAGGGRPALIRLGSPSERFHRTVQQQRLFVCYQGWLSHVLSLVLRTHVRVPSHHQHNNLLISLPELK